jgi:hypothetical protein
VRGQENSSPPAPLPAKPGRGEEEKSEPPFEPPSAGRPDNFRGAIGLFRIQAGTTTKSIPANQPFRYTVRITADASVPMRAPPTRPEIDRDPAFKERFFIEMPEHSSKKDGNVWEFYYTLRPKSVKVTEIPELSFSFFNPRFGDDPRGYQEPTTDPVSLTVTPAVIETPNVAVKGETSNYPDSIRGVAEDDEVLRRQYPWAPPSIGWLIALLLLPPLGALGWLVVWRRLYPDAARLARLRRSRAARDALKALQHLDCERQGENVAGIATLYLVRRFDLPMTSPTPGEVEAHLRGSGLPDELRQQAASLLQTCDALRFSAVPPAVSVSLVDAARELILALEARTCSSLPS